MQCKSAQNINIDTRQVVQIFFTSTLTILSLPTFADSSVLEFNGHRYQVIETIMNWTQAKAACEAKGVHLATITSKEENEFVFLQFAANQSLWFGGTDAENEGTWKWITGEAWSYSNWYAGEPNDSNHNEDYLQLTAASLGRGMSWNDIDVILCAGEIGRIGLFPAGCNAAVRPPGAIKPDNLARAKNNTTGDTGLRSYPLCEWNTLATTCDTTTPYNQGYSAAQSACKANPSSCGITVVSTSPTTTSGHATYNPTANTAHIPLLDVPTIFGGTPSVYKIDLTVMPNTNPLQLKLQSAKQVQ